MPLIMPTACAVTQIKYWSKGLKEKITSEQEKSKEIRDNNALPLPICFTHNYEVEGKSSDQEPM